MTEERKDRSLTVSPLQVDFQGFLSITELCDLLLETASLHATSVGFGFEDMHKENSAWVLTRLLIRIQEPAKVFDLVKIETWVDSMSTAFTTRKFNIRNGNGSVIASASSTWMLIDIKSRRPKLIEEGLFQYLLEPGKECLTGQPAKIEKPKIMGNPFLYRVKYSDIDIQNHVNSVKYLEWAIDQFPKTQFMQYRLYEVQINYLAETLFGDELEITSGQPAENEYILNMDNQRKTVCRASVTWLKK